MQMGCSFPLGRRFGFLFPGLILGAPCPPVFIGILTPEHPRQGIREKRIPGQGFLLPGPDLHLLGRPGYRIGRDWSSQKKSFPIMVYKRDCI